MTAATRARTRSQQRGGFADLHIPDDEVTIRKDLSEIARGDSRDDDLEEATQVLPGKHQMAVIHDADTLDFGDTHGTHDATPQDPAAQLAADYEAAQRSSLKDDPPTSETTAQATAHDRVTLAGTAPEALLAAAAAQAPAHGTPSSQRNVRTATVAAVRVAVVSSGVEGQARVVLLTQGEPVPHGGVVAVLVPASELDAAALARAFTTRL